MTPAPPNSYRAAGVDADAADTWLESLRGKLPAIGGFAALFRLGPHIAGMADPHLVACTDGVGTKVLVARAVGDYTTVGIDCVAMVLNDMVCCGARPLFFLDYLAVGRFDRAQADAILDGLRRGCDECGCEIIGGETAELPGLLPGGEFDICGFGVGVVDRARAIDGSRVSPGDVVVGLPSSGIHSNGLSLARRALPGHATDAALARLLLEPTRLYVRPVLGLLEAVAGVHGIAHITGGGIPGNLCRVLGSTCDARIDSATWEPGEVFRLLESHGGIDRAEMFTTFNMGIGLCIVCEASVADAVVARLAGSGARRMGVIVPGSGRVHIDGHTF